MIMIGIDKMSPYQVKPCGAGLVMTVPEISKRAAHEMEQSSAFKCLSVNNQRWAKVRMQGRLARQLIVSDC